MCTQGDTHLFKTAVRDLVHRETLRGLAMLELKLLVYKLIVDLVRFNRC